MIFNKNKKGFTIIEIIIAMGILALLFNVVYKLFAGVTTSFATNQWKLGRQRDIKIASKILKEKIQQATYPSKIIYTNADEKKNGLFYCTGAFYLSSGKNDAPGYIPNGGVVDLPGKEEAIRYLGDDGGISGEDTTFSMIYQPNANDAGSDGPPLPAKIQYPSINGKSYNIVDGTANADITSPFSNCTTFSKHECAVGAVTPIMSFLMSKPRREIATPEKGSLVRFNLYLQPGKNRTDPDQVDLVCDEEDLTIPHTTKKRKLIESIYKIEIAHRLLPNDPPIGDFLPSSDPGDPTYGFQFIQAGIASSSIQKLTGDYYVSNNSANGLSPSAKSLCDKDLRRGSVIGIKFFLRPFRDNTRGKRNILLVEEIQEKTNVRVFDTAL